MVSSPRKFQARASSDFSIRRRVQSPSQVYVPDDPWVQAGQTGYLPRYVYAVRIASPPGEKSPESGEGL